MESKARGLLNSIKEDIKKCGDLATGLNQVATVLESEINASEKSVADAKIKLDALNQKIAAAEKTLDQVNQEVEQLKKQGADEVNAQKVAFRKIMDAENLRLEKESQEIKDKQIEISHLQDAARNLGNLLEEAIKETKIKQADLNDALRDAQSRVESVASREETVTLKENSLKEIMAKINEDKDKVFAMQSELKTSIEKYNTSVSEMKVAKEQYETLATEAEKVIKDNKIKNDDLNSARDKLNLAIEKNIKEGNELKVMRKNLNDLQINLDNYKAELEIAAGRIKK